VQGNIEAIMKTETCPFTTAVVPFVLVCSHVRLCTKG